MDKRIKQSLNRAIENFPHPSLQEIIENKPERMSEHDFITKQETVGEKKVIQRFMPYPAILFCLVFIVMGGFLYGSHSQAVAIINLDVNPSFEIRVNRNNEVKKITGLNEEARRIIKRCDYKDKDLPVVIRMLFEQMTKDKYISRQKNTVLLSVKDKSGKRTDELKNELYSDITAVMEKEQISPNIIRQSLENRDKLSKGAKKLGISEGKLQFIRILMQFDPKLSEEELAELSMEELAGLVRDNGWDITDEVDIDDDSESDGDDDEEKTEKKEVEPEKVQKKAPEKAAVKSTEPPKEIKKKAPARQQPPAQKKNDDDDEEDDDDDENEKKQYKKPEEKKKIENNKNGNSKDEDEDDDEDDRDDDGDDKDEDEED